MTKKPFSKQVVDATDRMGRNIDRIDNVLGAFELPLPPAFHIEQAKKILAELSAEMKADYEVLTGENPWETHG